MTLSWGKIVMAAIAIVLGIFLGQVWWFGNNQDVVMQSAYVRVESKKVQDEILKLAEIFNSDSFKQADASVQSEASMTLETFLLQFGPALDEAKKTGETSHLGLLRAMMSGDKDAEILYRRELGLIKVKPYSGD